jgi:RNA polymerase sigma-70 factor (ECF subfamily)
MKISDKIFDGLLVLKYRSGNDKALSLLVKRHHSRLCKHANWYIHDIQASKDIAQDCWGIIINKITFLKNPNSFGAWAMKIVTRRSLDYLKKKKINRENQADYHRYSMYDENEQGSESELEELHKAIRFLPANQKIVLRLFYLEGYSIQEISYILEISTGTVKSRLYHSREKLKTILK